MLARVDPPREGKGCRITRNRRNKRWLERAIDSLRDVPGLVRRQKEDPLLGMVRDLGAG